VRRGDLHPAAAAEVVDREGHERRVDLAHVDDVGPEIPDPLLEALGQVMCRIMGSS
jgi:hypothetical protein